MSRIGNSSGGHLSKRSSSCCAATFAASSRQPALDLTRTVAEAPHLAFAGLQAYHGSAQHLRGWDERRQAIAQAIDRAGRTRDLLARYGIACPTNTGAGTGSFEFESASGVYTELQCGSYIFMDADYGRNRDRDDGPFTTFEPTLFVWATVMSRAAEDRAIVDAGLKVLAFDSGPPLVCDEPAATYERASDEHGRLAVSAATNRLGLGDKIRLIPGHCDPTVNLYDWYVCVRANRVEQLWPITARGEGEAFHQHRPMIGARSVAEGDAAPLGLGMGAVSGSAVGGKITPTKLGHPSQPKQEKTELSPR
jgi:3-hydroxy-D-aspartate aldolase